MRTDKELAELKRVIEDRIAETEHATAETHADRAPVQLDQQSVGRLSRMDAMQHQAMALAIEQRRQLEIARLKAALARIKEETYGICLDCGEEIMPARLRLDPAALLCLPCKQERDG